MCDTLTQQFWRLGGQRGKTHASQRLGTLLTVGACVLTEIVFHVRLWSLHFQILLLRREGGSTCTCKERGVGKKMNSKLEVRRLKKSPLETLALLTYMHTHTYIHTHTHAHIHTRTCTHTHAHTHMHTHTCTHTCTHTHTHTHTHTSFTFFSIHEGSSSSESSQEMVLGPAHVNLL